MSLFFEAESSVQVDRSLIGSEDLQAEFFDQWVGFSPCDEGLGQCPAHPLAPPSFFHAHAKRALVSQPFSGAILKIQHA